METASGTADRPLPAARALLHAAGSWRTVAVVLLSFSSGLPLGLVWIAIPDWLRSTGVDIRVVGLVTLAQAPWTFKFLWSPLMDRYVPPFFGRRRGWAALAQLALLVATLGLAGVGDDPEAPWVVGALALAIAFASASQDIAVDAYAVDVLRPAEQGVVVGARAALYRGAMFVAGALSITLAGRASWPTVCVGLAGLYLPALALTWRAPEPPAVPGTPRTLRAAVWEPFLGFLARRRSLEILAFVFFFKLGDHLAEALLRPFLVDMGYSGTDRGVALGTIALGGVLTGALAGGALTQVIGLGRSLWVFGLLQILSNAGYLAVAQVGVHRPLMFAAMGFESLIQGLGTGAFSVFLLRMTQKRFSATQYALLSSLFGLPRLLCGPAAGFAVHTVGWSPFFGLTMAAGVPGLILLSRFVPWHAREVPLDDLAPPRSAAKGLGAPLAWGLGGGAAGLLAALTAAVSLERLEAGVGLGASLARLAEPDSVGDGLVWLGIAATTVVAGLLTAAFAATRKGQKRSPPGVGGEELSRLGER